MLRYLRFNRIFKCTTGLAGMSVRHPFLGWASPRREFRVGFVNSIKYFVKKGTVDIQALTVESELDRMAVHYPGHLDWEGLNLRFLGRVERYNVQVLYEDRIRRWSRYIWQRRCRIELRIDSESGGRDQGLQINLVPGAPEQLPHIVKRANLTRLPIWRSSRLKSRQNHRTIASDSDSNIPLFTLLGRKNRPYWWFSTVSMKRREPRRDEV